MSRITCLALSICLLGTASSSAIAQGDAMTELYGVGVHRYFAGDYTGAEQVLSQVVASGSLDPRAHYYRGLAREMLGQGGDVDFETGAQLEAEGRLVVPVGMSLTRIQGAMRGKIERARRDARVLVRQQQLMAQQEARDAAAVTPASGTEPAPTPPTDVVDSNPFPGGGLRSDDASVDATQPATPEIDAKTDPFGDDPAPVASDPAPAAGGDPFGGSGADPFGGDTSGGSGGADPFGGSSSTPPAGGADPFGGSSTPSTGGADPFGGSTSGGAGSSDPFGGADPFGN